MKKFYLSCTVALFSLLALGSCSDSSDDNNYVSLVTVTENSEGKLLFLRSDSSLMNPTNFTIISNPGQRMLIEYEIRNTFDSNTPYRYDVEIEDFDLVLTKDAIDLTAANEAMVGNDPFWNIYGMNSGGGFLNAYVGFLYNYNPHTINLVANTITPPTPAADTIQLELRQNANGANVGFPIQELVSFNVGKYITAAKTNGIKTLVMGVKVLLPNSNSRIYYVKFDTENSVTNPDPSYNSLEAYKPTTGATN